MRIEIRQEEGGKEENWKRGGEAGKERKEEGQAQVSDKGVDQFRNDPLGDRRQTRADEGLGDHTTVKAKGITVDGPAQPTDDRVDESGGIGEGTGEGKGTELASGVSASAGAGREHRSYRPPRKKGDLVEYDEGDTVADIAFSIWEPRTSRVIVGEDARVFRAVTSLNFERALMVIPASLSGDHTPKGLRDELMALGKKLAERAQAGVFTYAVPDGEAAKGVAQLLRLLRFMHAKKMGRGDALVAVGGGTVMDLGGLASSLYMRGTLQVNVPTTLLAMVDASVGGKNGIDFDGEKNLVGVFRQPNFVMDDVSFLKNLPPLELASGYSEVIKYAVTLDSGLGDYLTKNYVDRSAPRVLRTVVERSVKDKMSLVVRDELDERGERVTLNFGHTIAHAIETGSRFEVPHGLAVAVGMVAEVDMGIQMGLTRGEVRDYLVALLRLFGLPTDLRELEELTGAGVSRMAALSALDWDKKRVKGGYLSMPILQDVGECVVERVRLGLVKKAVADLIGTGEGKAEGALRLRRARAKGNPSSNNTALPAEREGGRDGAESEDYRGRRESGGGGLR